MKQRRRLLIKTEAWIRANERRRCLAIIRKHIKRESCDRCCDACWCQALRKSVAEIGATD